MKFTIPLLVMVVAIALISRTTAAPQTPQPAAASPTVLGDLQKDWQVQKDSIMKIGDAMPEAKWGYKSTPAQRSYGEQVMHVAEVNVDLLKVLGGKAKAPAFAAGSAKTKAQALKALADSYDYGTALLNEQSDATLRQTVQASWLGPSTRARVVWTLLAHTMDIYGQMAVYLRLNGIVPPASRGA
jgi:uncharacterized damage-inducible protein DinB